MEKSKYTLIYDIAGLPNSMTMQEVAEDFKEHNVVRWCSTAAGNMCQKNLMPESAPRIVDLLTAEKVDGVKIVDLGK